MQQKDARFLYRPPKVRPKSNDQEVGIFMAKYSFEFKKKVVLEYWDGNPNNQRAVNHTKINSELPVPQRQR